MVIIKTNADTINNVVRHSKHALTKRPTRLSKGDIILIAQTKNTLLPHQEPIQYMMEFDHCYTDTKEESKELFGKYWRYILVSGVTAGD